MKHDAPHPSDETLLRSVDDELSPRDRSALDTHLAVCEGCRGRLRAIHVSADEATSACREGAAVAQPPVERMRARLRAGLEQRSSELDRSWGFRIARHMARVPSAAFAAAAVVALVLGASVARSAFVGGLATGSTATIEAGALPIRALTPGATALVTADDLCSGRGPAKEEIAPAVRQAVLRDYGMDGLPDSDYELDYLITPELGGSSDRRNLWPERYGARVWNARVKDQLELLLPSLVCRGAVDLSTAQREIAVDWIAAYKKYFHTDRPVVAQARAALVKDPEFLQGDVQHVARRSVHDIRARNQR
jgi:hypothetical protein